MKLGQLQSHYGPELSRAKAGQKDPSGVHTCMVKACIWDPARNLGPSHMPPVWMVLKLVSSLASLF